MLKATDIRLDKGSDWREESDGRDGTGYVVLVSYGKCLYRIGQEKVIAEKGDILLIPPGVSFYGIGIPTVVHEKYVAVFVMEGASPGLPLLTGSGHRKWNTGRFELLVERWRSLVEEWRERQSYYELLCGAQLLELLVLLNRETDQGRPADMKMQYVDAMKRYIREHYREKVTKEHLADAIGKSPGYAATLFRSVTGQTISGYVHMQRMRTAAYLLQESHLTIADIADYLGYCDASFFHRMFKRTMGRSPSVYLEERERS